MKLIALLVGLLVERLATQLFHLRRLRWLDRIIDAGFRQAERAKSLPAMIPVILLAVLYEFSVTGEVNWINAVRVLAYVSLFFLIAPVLAKLMSRVIGVLDQRIDNPGLIPVTVVSLVLFFAWLAHAVGAPELLGGFAAGLALSRRFFLPFGIAIRTDKAFAESVEGQMKPIIHLFTPIFFVMVGLSLNLREVDWSSPYIWGLSLSLTAVAVAGKLAGGFLAGEGWRRALAIGIAMTPRGEVGLVFAELGRLSGILDNQLYTGLIIAIAITTLITPFALKGFYARYGSVLPADEPLS